MSKPWSYQEIQKLFSERNLSLESQKYLNSKSKLAYKCGVCGYTGQLRLNDLLQKNVGCKKCSTMRRSSQRRLTPNEIDQTLLEKKILRIESSYINVSSPIKLKCLVCQSFFETPLLNIRAGGGCPVCSIKRGAAKRRLSNEELQRRFEENGKTILSPLSDYKNSYSHLLIRNNKCGCEYNCSIQALNKTGVRCGKCSVTAKIQIEEYESEARKWNGRIISMARRANIASTWWCPDNGGHEFKRSLTNIKQTQSYCNICSSSTAELRLKALVEKLFEKPFLKVRPKDMVSRKGVPIEFDLYNEDLRIAVEHHGAHHFRSQSNWSGDDGFKTQIENDAIRREYSSKHKILLIEIPELGAKTSLTEAKEIILKALLDTGRELPPEISQVDVEKLEFRSRVQEYLVRFEKAAAECGLNLISKGYEHSDKPIKVSCSRCNNAFFKTPRSILQGKGCPLCKLKAMKKAVQLSDGRVFASGAEAASALGTTKDAVNKAVRQGREICGLRVMRL